MPRLLPIMLAGSLAVLTAGAAWAADRPPELNVDQSCHAAATTGVRSGTPQLDDSACKRDESTARSKLNDEWSQFSSNDRETCVRLSTHGGGPSYVELLTCLELAKQAAALPDQLQERR
jgi:hypothetical protein